MRLPGARGWKGTMPTALPSVSGENCGAPRPVSSDGELNAKRRRRRDRGNANGLHTGVGELKRQGSGMGAGREVARRLNQDASRLPRLELTLAREGEHRPGVQRSAGSKGLGGN